MQPPSNPQDLKAPGMPRAVAELSDALTLANMAAVTDIETYSVRVQMDGSSWYDTRPMLDPREHAPEALDLAALVLRHAEQAGLIYRHSQHRYLVRLAPAPPAPSSARG